MENVVHIIITGGAVQYVDTPPKVRVIIQDYDVEGIDDDENMRTDENGDRYLHLEYYHE